MRFQIRPRVTTELDSRLWEAALRDLLQVDLQLTFTLERAEVPVADLEISSDITVKAVVDAGRTLNLTILEI